MTLRRLAANRPGSGHARMVVVFKGPCVDWDWNGENDPYTYDGEMEWMIDWAREDEEDKYAAPSATVDLISIAKPAKGRKRATQRESLHSCLQTSLLNRLFTGTAPPSTRTHSLAVTTASDILLGIDGVSTLEFSETWEHHDLERLDLGVDDERGSEWQWECFREF